MMKELYERTGKPVLYKIYGGWCCKSPKVFTIAHAKTREEAYLKWLIWVTLNDTQKIEGIEKQVIKYRNRLFNTFLYKGILG